MCDLFGSHGGKKPKGGKTGGLVGRRLLLGVDIQRRGEEEAARVGAEL